MRRVVLSFTLLLTVVGLAVSVPIRARAAEDGLAAAFQAFWDAKNPQDADKAASRIAAAGADFDSVFAQLRSGRVYAKQPAGPRWIRYSNSGAAFSFDDLVDVPAGYDQARKWPVRVQLHGGIGRDAPAEDDADRLLSRISSEGLIQIHPHGWVDAAWWNANQVDNIFRVLDEVKRTYNVDESRVYVTGISDGGTGVYYFGMRAVTPWAACMPLNGNIAVLANPDVGAEGELFLGNLVNCPFHAVNGGRDRLYPAAHVAPFINLMKRAGVQMAWQVYPEAGHDTSWWPVERARYEEFLAMHPREANPERLSWETERVDRYNRVRWLVINALGARPSDSKLEPAAIGAPEESALRRLVSTQRVSGRVDVTRHGNAFEARTRGVREFSVLLSPDAIDFARPVTVTVNGKTAFDGIVKKDVGALVKWAARDNDRTMLYGAELKIAVP
jgi:predicted esterase